MKVQPIYNNRIFKKGLEFAADKSSLFIATTSLALSTVVRPIAIMSTPKTDKENKKYACAKSLSSSAVGYLVMLAPSLWVSNAIKKIHKNPIDYLKKETIKTLQAGEKTLQKSKRFTFATQLFNLGLGFLIAVPKSILTCAMIPPLMKKVFNKKDKPQQNPSFTGNLSKGIGKLIDTSAVQKLSEKFHNTNFEMHIMNLTDTLATSAFIFQTKNSQKIEHDRKKALMYNAGISTGLSIAGGYIIDKLLEKPTQNFIKKFTEANKNSPKLEKYIEGIRIAKSSLILGGIYYIAIPLVATFLADRTDKKTTKF